MNFLLNPITAQKMVNLQVTVRRLIIIVLSLSYGAYHQSVILDHLAEPHYQPNESQFAKYCQTPQNDRFQLAFWCFSSKRHFRALTVKFELNLNMA